MPDKEIFVLKIVWKKSIASLHRLTQAVQCANLRRTAGDPTWVLIISWFKNQVEASTHFSSTTNSKLDEYEKVNWICQAHEGKRVNFHQKTGYFLILNLFSLIW